MQSDRLIKNRLYQLESRTIPCYDPPSIGRYLYKKKQVYYYDFYAKPHYNIFPIFQANKKKVSGRDYHWRLYSTTKEGYATENHT